MEFLDRFSQANTNSVRASLLLSSLLVFGLWSYLPHDGLLAWLFTVWTAQVAHEVYSRAYRMHRANGPGEYRRWLPGFQLGAAVVGVCWSLPFLVFGALTEDAVLLLVFAIAGVTAYGGLARATVLSVALIFEFATVLPMGAWLFQQDSAIHRTMGMASLLYLVMLTPLLRKMNQMATRTLLLDGENHRLSDEQNIYLERLRRSEEEYRMLATNLPVAVIRYDAEQRRRYINPAAERMLHGNTAQMLGQVPGEGGVPATPAMIERYRGRMAEVLATGEIREFEFVLDALPEGRHEHYHIRMAPEYGEDGKIVGSLTTWFDVTERKRMEEELRLKERVLDQAHEGVYLIDERARFVYANDGACRALGYSREELLGMGVQDIDHAYSVEDSIAVGKKSREEGSFTFETQHRRRDGSLFPVEIQASALGYQGKHLGLAMARDITERKRVAEALAEREREFRTLAENFPDIIIRYDVDCRRIYANPAFWEFAGRSQGETIGATPQKSTPLTDPEGYMAELRKVMHRGTVSRLELSAHRANGELAWYAGSFVPERDVKGRIIGVLVVARDISERKRAVAALAERERAFRSLAENLPDNIARWDTEGRYLYVNPTHERMLGKRLEELIGRGIPDSHEQVKAAIAQVLSTGQASRAVREAAMVGGVEQLHDVDLVPEFDEAGKVVSVLGIGRDMTERYRMLEAIAAREQAFRSLAESSPDYIIRYDRDGRALYLNGSLVRGLGLSSASEGLGFRPSETWPDGRYDAIEQAAARAVETGEEQRFEMIGPRPSGELGFNQIFVVPERGVNGDIVGTIAFGRDITEIKLAEARLSNERATLRAFFGAMPNLAWMKDVEGRYLACNPMFEQLYGQSEAAILGKTDFDFVDAELATFFRRKDNEAEAAGKPCVNEEWVTFACDGRRALIETVKAPVTDASGKVIGVIGVAHDITERKKMELAVAEREAFLKTLLDAIAIPVFYKDREGRYLGVNRAYEQSFGVNRENLIGKSVFETHPREQAEIYHAKDLEVFERRVERQEYEFQARHSDGTLRDVMYSKAAFADAQGEVQGLIGAVMDITERKQAETLLQERYERIVELNAHLEENACTLEEQAVELEASKEQLMLTEAWYRGILQSAPDGMVVVDGRGVICLTNTQFGRMFGYEDGELLGQSIDLLVPLGMRNAHETFRAGVVDSDSQVRPMADVAGSRKDGSEFFVDVSLARLPDMEGAVGTICAAIRDVTERKCMEQALAEREQEFRTLVENSADTVARYGRDMRRLYVNPALAALVEGGAAALLGRTPMECPGGAGAAMYEDKLAEAVAEGRGVEFELKWPDRAGREMCSLINLTPEFDAQGEVASVLAVGRDITELNAFRHRIHQMAFYDSLTSLPNRALFNDRLRQMITDAAWHGQQAGLMMIDMDRFKAVNDTLGHPAGDELLRETAARLSTCVRAYDTVARLGGDEFAILLPEIRFGDDLGRIASKILAVFERPFLLEGKEVFVSCSIGIALYPCDSRDADDLLKYADSAMYFAKRSGRNNFRFYSRDLTESAHERLVLESDLRRAIEREELELFYQPKVSLCDGALTGSEALLRWKHPERGMVAPDMFIGIAEDSGLIVEIGEWVLRKACRTARRWNGEGKPLHKVSINLSARQFQGGDLAGTVCRALEESGCRPEWIELEITESLLLDDGSEVLDVLNGFRAMGISIAIDDFGTGYSALSYLARFPIATLKIDRSFISRITTDKYRAELVKAILSIARCLGQLVVAEGVETEAQADFLRAHGCQVAQGYLYGKPMPVADFEGLQSSFDRQPV